VVTLPVTSAYPVGEGNACPDGTGDDEDEERKDAPHGSSFGRIEESQTNPEASVDQSKGESDYAVARLELAVQAG
jgi:hypothetical protein